MPNYTILYYTVLYHTILFCIILYYAFEVTPLVDAPPAPAELPGAIAASLPGLELWDGRVAQLPEGGFQALILGLQLCLGPKSRRGVPPN